MQGRSLAVVVAGLAGLALVGLGMRWWTARAAESAPRREGDAPKPAAALVPESLFVLKVTDAEVVCERPDGKVERVRWDDLQKVEIVTTDKGPMEPDVFWVLHGSKTGVAAPQGATGENELLDRLLKLPGFDNKALIDAMSSATNKRFLCWQRKR